MEANRTSKENNRTTSFSEVPSEILPNGNSASVDIEDLAFKIAVSKLISAFKGRSFHVSELRDITRASGETAEGKEWRMLKMASGTKVRQMSKATLKDLTATTAQFFGLPEEMWVFIPPSRLRWGLAIKDKSRAIWIRDLSVSVLAAAAFLEEEVRFIEREDPVDIARLSKAIAQGQKSIAVPQRRKGEYQDHFVLSDEPGEPASIES